MSSRWGTRSGTLVWSPSQASQRQLIANLPPDLTPSSAFFSCSFQSGMLLGPRPGPLRQKSCFVANWRESRLGAQGALAMYYMRNEYKITQSWRLAGLKSGSKFLQLSGTVGCRMGSL